jgi:hypothetical protein
MTYSEYVAQLIALPKPSDWRPGQWAFNLLHEIRPELADDVRGGDLDPYHDDKRLGAFMAWLMPIWDTSINGDV